MLCRTGEVERGRPKLAWLDYPYVNLQPFSREHRRLSVSVTDDFGNDREGNDRIHHFLW